MNKAIRIALIETGHNQTTLAVEIGISRQWLISILHGKWRGAEDVRVRIAVALGHDMAWLDSQIPPRIPKSKIQIPNSRRPAA